MPKKHEHYVEYRELVLDIDWDDAEDGEVFDSIQLFVEKVKKLAKKGFFVEENRESFIKIRINLTRG